MKAALRQSTWALVTVALLAMPAAAQGPEDLGPAGAPSQEGTLTTIPAPTVEMEVYDFDLMPGGSTTVGAITATFPDGLLTDITTTPRNNANGVYNFQTDNGRALSADPAGGGGLFLVDPPAGVFDEVDDITFLFTSPVTEFGFQIGDWSGDFDCECFDGAASVGRVTVITTAPNLEFFVQSAAPFDSCLLTALPAFPGSNWVVPGVQIPTEPVPVELQSLSVE